MKTGKRKVNPALAFSGSVTVRASGKQEWRGCSGCHTQGIPMPWGCLGDVPDTPKWEFEGGTQQSRESTEWEGASDVRMNLSILSSSAPIRVISGL